MPFRLNPQQKRAVTYARGPLLIIAGAGTGKTTVITERVKHLLQKKKAKPEEILALTFTEKAAGEMVERLDVVMPLGYQEPWVSTFHAFCDRILREEGLEIGLSPDYKILSQPEQWFLLKKNLFEFELNYYRPLGNPTKFIGALLKFFSRLQDEDITPAELENYKKEEKENLKKYQELFKAFEFYQKLKLKKNVLDFGDLISWTLKLFRKRQEVLKKYQQQFKHILVDEFQDTNFAQLQLIKLLAPAKNNPNLAVTGDDDQAVYAFRGTSVYNILNFKKYYPKAKEVVLVDNYRSGQKLLDKAYQLIQYNNPDRLEKKLKVDKKLVSQRKKKLSGPEAVAVDTLEAEADFVAAKILELTAKKPCTTHKDFAVLARANNHLEPFVAAFKRYQIPYQLVGNRGLFDQEEIKDLLFFLRIVVDLEDTPSLFQLLHADVFEVEPESLLNMLQQAKKERKSLWKIVESASSSDRGLHLLVEQVETARQRAVKESASPILYEFIQKTDYIKALIKEESLENQLKINNLNLFFNHLKRFETEQENNLLVDFVEYVSLMIEAGENPAQAEMEDIDTVRLLTVHSAKGLEFPIVFVVNLVADRFPSRRRRDPIEIPEGIIKETLPKGDYHLQEERRLFYVAVTRAKDRLYLLAGQDYGGARKKKPSIFIKEMDLKIESWKEEEKNQLSWMNYKQKTSVSKPILSGKLELNHISYSQIDVYLTCPLKYKYQYILQVPTKPHSALSYGISIHNTLQQFHLFNMKGHKIGLSALLNLYEENFLNRGYDSLEHRKKRFVTGKKALKKYFNIWKQQFTGRPIFLEKTFWIKIDDFFLKGRIDRIDESKQGLELIDYKTGETKDQEKVDKDAQLTIYAMASQRLFGKLPDNLSLYFVDNCQKINTERSEGQIRAKKQQICKTVRKIRQSRFGPKPNPHNCLYCSYLQICPFAKRS